MPGRLTPLVNDQIYHVYNRGIDHRPTFTDKKEFERGLLALSYYSFSKPPMKLSYFLKLSNEERSKKFANLSKTDEKLVKILVFCLMPNHFHFLLKQISENGISRHLSNLQNSYTRYFNTRNQRIGPLFLDQFKARLIETDEQFIHVSRYIHLNPLTSYVVKDFKHLKNYPWSSIGEYLNGQGSICNTQPIMAFFKNAQTYEKFMEDQKDYQRELHKIKHLTLE